MRMLPFLVAVAVAQWLLAAAFGASMVDVVTPARDARDLAAFLGWCGLLSFGAAALAVGPARGLEVVARRAAWLLLVIASAGILTFSYVDARAFVAQGVHLYDPIAVQALTNPDANRELHLGWEILAETGLALLTALALCSLFAWRSARIKQTKPFAWALAVLLGASLFGVLDQRARIFDPGSALAPALPLARILFGQRAPSRAYGITYPGPLAPHKMERRPDITVIAIESLRADALTPALMPELTRFAQARACIVPKRHFSSSHATELGIFSLLYGLDASRYPAFSRAHTPSALLTILRDAGYTLRGGSASGLRGWNGAGFIADQFPGFFEPRQTESWRRDAALSAWARALPAVTPAFTFLFLDATHLDYSYPPELEIDKPVLRDDFTRYLARNTLQARKTEVVNRYRNAVRFVDRTLGELLPKLGNGVVVVTGDHGEEFWEHDLLGHSAPRFWNQRIQVPLVLCLPGTAPSDVERSSHADVLPTVLSWAGVTAPADGESLLTGTHGDVVVTGAGFPVDDGNVALIDAKHKLWLAADPAWADRYRLVRATDLDDQPVPPPDPDAQVGELVRRFHRFLK
jgi:membrane-anchored protein YejM (alkaline phosphatase superfamily)